jgi:hypothetical protein
MTCQDVYALATMRDPRPALLQFDFDAERASINCAAITYRIAVHNAFLIGTLN